MVFPLMSEIGQVQGSGLLMVHYWPLGFSHVFNWFLPVYVLAMVLSLGYNWKQSGWQQTSFTPCSRLESSARLFSRSSDTYFMPIFFEVFLSCWSGFPTNPPDCCQLMYRMLYSPRSFNLYRRKTSFPCTMGLFTLSITDPLPILLAVDGMWKAINIVQSTSKKNMFYECSDMAQS